MSIKSDRIPGATSVDKAAHLVFLAAGSDDTVSWRPSSVTCKECGDELETYYCEERLYAVRCRKCEVVMLTKSRGPGLAAIQFARAGRWEARYEQSKAVSPSEAVARRKLDDI